MFLLPVFLSCFEGLEWFFLSSVCFICPVSSCRSENLRAEIGIRTNNKYLWFVSSLKECGANTCAVSGRDKIQVT
jgi:hypothetical protein